MKQKNRQLINGLPRRILLMLLDCGLIVFCYYLAILLRVLARQNPNFLSCAVPAQRSTNIILYSLGNTA